VNTALGEKVPPPLAANGTQQERCVMPEPNTAPARIGSNSLPELAAHIVREHESIQNAPYVVPRAIRLGKLLIEAKNHEGQYGKWATWLKDNCKEMTDRTAQRYMNLALNAGKLEEILRQRSTAEKRHTMSDLTFNEACRLIVPPREPKQPNRHNEYVAAEEKLLDKLALLGNPAAIKEAAEITIRHLKNTVDHLLQERKVA
jgi:hypothetical protein